MALPPAGEQGACPRFLCSRGAEDALGLARFRGVGTLVRDPSVAPLLVDREKREARAAGEQQEETYYRHFMLPICTLRHYIVP